MKSVGQMLMPVCRLWNGHGRRHLQTFGLSFNTDMYSSSSIRLGPLCTSLHNTCQKPLTLLCVRYLRTSPWRPNVEVSSSIQKNVQGLMVKRPARKKIPAIKGQDEEVMYKVQAYATAEEYGLDELSAAIKRQGLYAVMQLPKDAENVLYVRAKYELDETLREIFFFSEGCAVFWNMPETERNEVLRFVSQFSESEYSPSLIEQEVEDMDFVHTDKSPGLVGGTIQIRESVEGMAQIEESVDTDKAVLDKFAFSNALSLSVKLGVWEASLDKFVESIQPVLQDMKDGRKLRMSRHVALQKTGELFTLRHLINLSSDLLDPPDFYWDREQLEGLYQQTFSYLNIPKRTKVMNEKLNHCCELTDLVISHLNDNHHVRLEWMIILLILVEVVFEVIHYIEKYTVQPAAISSEEPTAHADQPR